MDFSNSVIMPREDFMELSTVAWANPPKSLGDRTATVVQTILICSTLAGAFAAATRSWTKSMKQLEDAKLANKITELEETEKTRNK